MKKTLKRFLASVLCAAMLVSVLPVTSLTALADELQQDPAVQTVEPSTPDEPPKEEVPPVEQAPDPAPSPEQDPDPTPEEPSDPLQPPEEGTEPAPSEDQPSDTPSSEEEGVLGVPENTSSDPQDEEEPPVELLASIGDINITLDSNGKPQGTVTVDQPTTGSATYVLTLVVNGAISYQKKYGDKLIDMPPANDYSDSLASSSTSCGATAIKNGGGLSNNWGYIQYYVTSTSNGITFTFDLSDPNVKVAATNLDGKGLTMANILARVNDAHDGEDKTESDLSGLTVAAIFYERDNAHAVKTDVAIPAGEAAPAAELSADPKLLLFTAQNEKHTVTLKNTVDGSTAKIESITLKSGSDYSITGWTTPVIGGDTTTFTVERTSSSRMNNNVDLLVKYDDGTGTKKTITVVLSYLKSATLLQPYGGAYNSTDKVLEVGPDGSLLGFIFGEGTDGWAFLFTGYEFSDGFEEIAGGAGKFPTTNPDILEYDATNPLLYENEIKVARKAGSTEASGYLKVDYITIDADYVENIEADGESETLYVPIRYAAKKGTSIALTGWGDPNGSGVYNAVYTGKKQSSGRNITAAGTDVTSSFTWDPTQPFPGNNTIAGAGDYTVSATVKSAYADEYTDPDPVTLRISQFDLEVVYEEGISLDGDLTAGQLISVTGITDDNGNTLVSDDPELSYMWYYCTDNKGNGATLIEKAEDLKAYEIELPAAAGGKYLKLVLESKGTPVTKPNPEDKAGGNVINSVELVLGQIVSGAVNTTMAVSPASATYDGTAKTVTVSATDADSNSLTYNTDYTVSWTGTGISGSQPADNNGSVSFTNAGTYKAAATMKDPTKYNKPADVTFTISPFDLSGATLTVKNLSGAAVTAGDGIDVGGQLQLDEISDLTPQANDVVYQWQTKEGDGAWTNIASATGVAYTPVKADAGKSLRLLVSAGSSGNTINSKAFEVGTVRATVYTGTITLTWDDETAPSVNGAPKTTTVALRVSGAANNTPVYKTATLGTQNSVTFDDLPVNSKYDIYVTNGAVTQKYTATNAGEGAYLLGESGEANAAQEITINLFSVHAKTNGNGLAALDIDNMRSGQSNASEGNEWVTWALPGSSVKWTGIDSASDAHKDYTFGYWDDNKNDTTSPKTVDFLSESITHTTNFVKRVTNVTFNFKDVPVSGEAAEHKLVANTVIELRNNNIRQAGTTLSGEAATATIAVPWGDTLRIFVGTEDTGVDVKVESAAYGPVDVNWYELAVEAKSAKGGKVGIGRNDSNKTSDYYLPNRGVTVAASTANTNYQFNGWKVSSGTEGSLDASAATALSRTFTMGKGAVKLTAQYERVSYTQKVTVKVNGTAAQGLTVSANNAGVATKTTDGSGVVELTLYPNTTYNIGVSDTNKEVGDLTIATFVSTQSVGPLTDDNDPADMVLDYYTLTTATDNQDANNKVSQNSRTAGAGETVGYFKDTNVAVVGTPGTGYRFKNWTAVNYDALNTNTTASGTVTMPESAVTLTANFQRQYTVTAAADPADGGTVTVTGVQDSSAYDKITDSNKKGVVDPNHWVKLSADPADGKRLLGWTASDSTKAAFKKDDAGTTADTVTENSTSYAMGTGNDIWVVPSDDITVTAHFGDDKFTPAVTLKDLTSKVVSGQTVTLKRNGTDYETSETGAGTGIYSPTDPIPANSVDPGNVFTYDVYVNGYDSGVDVKFGEAKKDVTVLKVTTATAGADSDLPEGHGNTAQVKATSGTTFGTSLYIPKVENDLSVDIQATKASGYRFNYVTVGTSTTAATTAWDPDATSASVSGTTMTGTYTVAGGTNADVTLTAKFVPVVTVTAAPTSGDAGTATVAEVKQAGQNSVTSNVATVDGGDWVKLSADPGDGKRLLGWQVTTGTATLSKSDTGNGDATEVTDNGKTYYMGTGKEIWVTASENVTVTAHFVDDKFDATITTKYNNTATAEGVKKVEVKNAAGTTVVATSEGDTPAITGTDGVWTVKGLTADSDKASTSDKTVYTVWVNGYKTGKTLTFDPTGAAVSVDVTMVKLTLDADVTGTKGTRDTNYSYQITTQAVAKGNGPVYVPSGADGAIGTVTLDAAISADNAKNAQHYRLANGTTEDLWTVKIGNADEGKTGLGNQTASTTFNITNATADVTITAHFVQQDKVTIAAGEANWGSVIGDTVVYVDSNGTDQVKLESKPESGYLVKGWVANNTNFTGIYSTGTNVIVPFTEGSTNYYVHTNNNTTARNNAIYVDPAGDVTMTVHFQEDNFTAKLTLKHKGTDIIKDVKIEIYEGDTVVASTTNGNINYVSADSAWEATLPNKTGNASYTVKVNGYDVPGVTLTGADKEKTINLFKIETKVKENGAEATSTTNKAYLKDAFGSTSATSIYVPSGANVASLPLSIGSVASGFRTGNADNSKMWEAANGTTTDTAKDSNGEFPGGGTYAWNSVTADVILYAHYTEVYTLTVTAGTGGTVKITQVGGTDITPAESASVDHGKSATVVATPDDGNAINAYAFEKWAIESGTGVFGADASSTATEATTATATFFPNETATVKATFKHVGVSAPTGGDPVSYVKVDANGITWTVTAGYDPSEYDVTLPLTNKGTANTGALTATLESGGSNPKAEAFKALGGDANIADIAAGGSANLTMGLGTAQPEGTYTYNLKITDGENLTLTVPLTLVVNNPSTFTAVVDTYPGGQERGNGGIYDIILKKGSSTYNYTAATSANGSYTFDSLPFYDATAQGATGYAVWINGYDTGMKVTTANITSKAPFEVKNLYIVDWAENSYTGGKPSFATTGGTYTVKPATDATADGAKSTITLPVGAAVTLTDGAQANTADGKHYRYETWQKTENGAASATDFKGTNTYTVPAMPAEGTEATAKLGGVYVQQFIVTLAGSDPAGAGKDLKVTQTDDISKTGTATLTVDAEKTVKLEVTANDGFVFKEWTATETGKGDFGSDTAAATKAMTAEFTPTDDVTLQPNFWTRSKLERDNPTYDIGGNADPTTNKAPVLKFTANDGTFVKYQYKLSTASDFADLPDAAYETAAVESGPIPSTLKADWMKENFTNGKTYEFKAIYDIGGDHANKQTGQETATVSVEIKSTAATLGNVTVQVKGPAADNHAETARVGGADNTDVIEYVSHEPTGIAKKDLAWVWYKSATKPEGTAESNIPADVTVIDGQTDDSYTVQSGDEGYYIFAKVTASNTGSGSVLTNAVAVDYEAVVKLTVDGQAMTADHTQYQVKVTADDGASFTALTWNSTDAYTGVVTGGQEYKVYVNEVQNVLTDAALVDTTKVVKPTAGDREAEVAYFTVNHSAYNITNATNSTGNSVGEKFDNTNTPAIASVTTKSNNAVANGSAVLTGTKVTVKSAAWNQDYKLDWQTSADNTTWSDTATKEQTSTDASVTGLVNYAVESKTYLRGHLNQQTYTVTGKVVAENNGKITGATLTVNGHTFIGQMSGADISTSNQAGNDAVVTFTVPKVSEIVGSAITDGYTLSASVENANPATTLKGYKVPASASGDPTMTPDVISVSGKTDDAFTIHVTASTWKLTASDGTNSYTADVTATSGNNKNDGTVTKKVELEYDYADGSAPTVTLTITNDGTAELKKVNVAAPTGFDDIATTGDTSTLTMGMEFDLPAGESKTLTFTVKDDLGTDVSKAYDFVVTSKKEDGTDGPKVTYKLDLEIKAKALAGLTIQSNNTDTAVAVGGTNTTAKAGLTSDPDNKLQPYDSDDGTGDLIYHWVYTDTETAPTVDATGNITGGTLFPSDADAAVPTVPAELAGKYVWLVLEGKNNASGWVVSTNSVKVLYDAQVKLLDGSDSNAALGDAGYKVVISTNDADATANAITLAWNAAGYYETTETIGHLTPGTAYYVWVSALEGNEAMTKVADIAAKPELNTTSHKYEKEFTYYQVKFNDKVNVSSAYEDMVVGDDMIDPATHDKAVSAKVAEGVAADAAVENNKHVLTGTKVTFTASENEGKDYAYGWKLVEDTTETDLDSKAQTQDVTYSEAKDTVNAYLSQNTYEVKAYVFGGTVNSITLTDAKGNVFKNVADSDTTTNPSSPIFAAGTPANAVSSGEVTFKIPAGSYKLDDEHPSTSSYAGEDGKGYLTDFGGGNTAPEANTLNYVPVNQGGTGTWTVTSAQNFAIVMKVAGYRLTVSEVTNAEADTGINGGVASDDGGEIQANGTYASKTERDYGWTSSDTDTITVTLKNTGESTMKNVTLGALVNTDATFISLVTDGTSFASGPVASLAKDETATFQLKLADKEDDAAVAAGTYTVTLPINFYRDDGTTQSDAQLTYQLTVTVGSLGLTGIVTQVNGDPPAVADTGAVTAKVGDTVAYNSHENATIETKDITYQWYSLPHGTAPMIAETDGSYSITGGTAITGATGTLDIASAAYTVTAAEAGKDLYLLAWATGSGSGQVVSAHPIEVNYTGAVKVQVDGTQVTDNAKAAGFQIFLRPVDTTRAAGDDIEAVWNDDADAFLADKALTAGKDYKILVNRVEGNTTDGTKVDTGLTIKAADVAADGTSTETVNYFQVSYDETVTKANAYKPGTANFTENVENLTVTAATADSIEVASDKAVLKDTKVTFTETVAWTSDYSLSWHEEGVADALSTGKASGNTAQELTYSDKHGKVSAELDQRTYTMVGTISGTGSITKVTLSDGKNTYTTDSTAAGSEITDVTNTIGTGTAGGTIQVTVPAGTYAVAVTTASGTSVQTYFVATGKSTLVKSNPPISVTADKTTDDYDVNFSLELAESAPVLAVKDNVGSEAATESTKSDSDATFTREVKYTFADNTVTQTAATVNLENKGNTDLKVSMKIEKTDVDGKVTTVYETKADASAGSDDTANETKIMVGNVPTYTDGPFTLLAAGSTGTTNLNTATITVPVNLGKKDGATYTITFTSTMPDGTAGPKVAYKLQAAVEPLALTAANVEAVRANGDKLGSTEAPNVGDKLQLKNKDLANVFVIDNTTTAESKGIEKADLAFQWFKVPYGTTGDPVVTVTPGANSTAANTVSLKVGETAATVATGTGNNTMEYTVAEADDNQQLYLVVYSKNPGSNVIGSAVAAPIYDTKYTGEIKVSLDGNVLNGTDPNYNIRLNVENAVGGATGDGSIETEWDTDTNSYKTKTTLDPNKIYIIWAETVKGSGKYADTGLTFKGDSRDAKTVAYFSVKYKTDVEVTNTLATITNAFAGPLTGALTASVGTGATKADITADKTDGVPVLKGQKVIFAVDKAKENNDGKGWDNYQSYYVLDWTNVGTNATDIQYGAYDNQTLTLEAATDVISAALRQRVFKVEFAIVGTEGGQVTEAKLTVNETGKSGEIKATTSADAAHNEITGSGAATEDGGNKVIFYAPAGTYTVEATAITASHTASYKVNDTETTTVTVTTADHVTGNEIKLERSTYKLEFQDNFKGFGAASEGFNETSLTFGVENAAVQTKTVRVYNVGNSAIPKFKLTAAADTTNGSNTTSATLANDFTLTGLDTAKLYTPKAGGGYTETTNVNLTNNSVDLPVGGYAEFTVVIPDNKDAKTYAATLTASSGESSVTITGQTDYSARYTVKKADITAAGIGGITAPTYKADTSTTLGSLVNTTIDKQDSQKTQNDADAFSILGTPTWKAGDQAVDSSANIQPGTIYSVTVTLAPGANYAFNKGSYNSAYTLLAKAGGTGTGVTTEVVDGNLVMTYTFPATASGDLTVEVTTDAPNSGKVTQIYGKSSVAQDYYFVITEAEDDDSAPTVTAEEILSGMPTAGGSFVFTSNKLDGDDLSTKEGYALWNAGLSTTGLEDGTTYWVHAIAMPDGVTDASQAGAVTTKSFITHYKVTVKEGDNGSNIVTPAIGFTHVKADGTSTAALKAGEPESGYVFKEWKIVADASGNTGTGAFVGAATSMETTFRPTSNVTVQATYEGKAALTISGELKGNQIGNNYTAGLNVLEDAKITNDGLGQLKGEVKIAVVNDTFSEEAWKNNLNDLETFLGTVANTNFLAQNLSAVGDGNTLRLKKDGEATFTLNLKTDPSNLTPGTYKAKLLAYDSGDPGVYAVYDVQVVIVDGTGMVAAVLDQYWDLASTPDPKYAPRDIKITVTENAYHVAQENTPQLTSVLVNSDSKLAAPETLTADQYTYTNATDTTKQLLFKQAYIQGLVDTYHPAQGDKLTLTFTRGHEDSNVTPNTITITINFLDNTPRVTNVSLGSALVATGDTLTADIEITEYGDPGAPGTPRAVKDDELTSGQVLVTWYRVDPSVTVSSVDDLTSPADTSKVTKVQESSNSVDSKTYTLTADDAGKKLYAVAAGNGTDVKSSAYGFIQAGYLVTLESDPAGNVIKTVTLNPTSPAKVAYNGNVIVDLNLTDTKYIFSQWTIKKDSGTGIFTSPAADDVTGTATTWTEKSAGFWPTSDVTIVAQFAALPTLTPVTNNRDIGSGAADADKTALVLTYTKNSGSGNLKLEISPKTGSSNPGKIDGSDKTTIEVVADAYTASTTNGVTTYTFKDEWLREHLSAGEYTITYYDTDKGSKANGDKEPKYDVSADLIFAKTMKEVPVHTAASDSEGGVVTIGSKLTATPNEEQATDRGFTPANHADYVWYWSNTEYTNPDDVEKHATKLAETEDNTFTLAAGNNVPVGAHIYAVATGKGDFAGSKKLATPNATVTAPVYTVNAYVDANGAGGSPAENKGTAQVNSAEKTDNKITASTGNVASGSYVTLKAVEAEGYKFAGWKIGTWGEDGTFATTDGGSFGTKAANGMVSDSTATTSDSKEAYFYPDKNGVSVVAFFEAYPVEVAGDAAATVKYMTDSSYSEDGFTNGFKGKVDVKDKVTYTGTGRLTYTMAAWDDLSDEQKAGYTDETAFTADQKIFSNTDTSSTVNTGEAWLTLTEDGVITFNGKEVVDSKATEHILYVKVTAPSGESALVKLVLDVEKGDLKTTAEVKDNADKPHGDPVKPEDFKHGDVTNAQNQTIDHGAADDVPASGNDLGTWTITDENGEPITDPTYNGVGTQPKDYYITLTPADDNYNPVTVPVKVATAKPGLGMTFADQQIVHKPTGEENGDAKTPAENVTRTDNQTYLDDFYSYDVTLKNPNTDLADVKLTLTNTNFTISNVYEKGIKKSDLPTTLSAFNFGETVTFTVTPKMANGEQTPPAGTYTLKLTVTGKDVLEERETTATYELKLVVAPKAISEITISGMKEPGTDEKPTTVTNGVPQAPDTNKPGETKLPVQGDAGSELTVKDDAPDRTHEKTDKNSKTPYTVTIVWKDKDGNPVPDGGKVKDGETYTPVVTITPDPNYTLPEPGTDGTYTLDGFVPDGGTQEVEKDGDNIVITGKPVTVKAQPRLNYSEDKTIEVTVGEAISAQDITATLKDTGAPVYDVETTITIPEELKEFVTVTVDGAEEDASHTVGDMIVDATKDYKISLKEGIDTSSAKTYAIVLESKGAAADGGEKTVAAKYTLTIKIKNSTPPGPGPSGPSGPIGGGMECPFPVYYWIGEHGVTTDTTMETVEKEGYPAYVPDVTALKDYTFLGWSLTDPAKTKDVKLVDPAKTQITAKTIFYAVYKAVEHTLVEHKAYVIGYPDGTFGPADSINRASVATIIARACLEGFVEGYDYGNPGGYSDVEGHWAESAIAYCTMKGVFKGMDDGTFQPDRFITRQEFALVIARLAGLKTNSGMPFSDSDTISDWAVDGVYTSYANGWINGYPDGTFQPMNNIRRDEAVKIFNGYLNRGVDAQGLSEVKGLIAWPDVTVEGEWAYYEIMEAGNDHVFYWPNEDDQTPPEHWDSAWTDDSGRQA